MPSVSKAQQRFMGLVHAYKKGEVPASKVSKAVKDAAKSMKKKSTKKFAKTKHKGLPNKVRSENMNEDGHTDVASVERKLKLIIADAVDTIKKLRSMSNDDSLPSWWTDKITLAKDYVSKSRDYIMNPAEGVDEGFGGELKGRAKQKFEKARKANGEQLGYKLTGTSDIKESVNERISVSDERHFGKKGIIIMIDDNGKKVSAIFKDKKNANKFNRNKPADIKKLLQLAKKTKYPKAIDESVNERKNPKREKVKKSFLKNLQKTEKTIRRIKQFAKSNQWGPISNFVEDDLVYDMMALKNEIDKIISMPVDESVNEATSLGADMLLGGIATVIKKAGMRPKTAKMMGGGFKVSKRDKVGFKIDVEIRGMDKKKTFPLQFETERGMLYVVIKNKPIKLGKYTMVTQAAQNLKKVGAALIGDKDVKRIA